MAESAKKFDLLIKNVRVVRPKKTTVEKMDIAVKGGKIAKVGKGLKATDAAEVLDGKNQLAFPGCVDPHMHAGIYGPLHDDAYSESLAAAQGGVTSSINYMRTGGYYMEKGGPYAKVYPEVLGISKDRFWVDYAYHLAPLDRTHIGEIDMLIEKYGVTSFKIFMFYGGYGLHGASNSQREFLMIGEDERYDIADEYMDVVYALWEGSWEEPSPLPRPPRPRPKRGWHRCAPTSAWPAPPCRCRSGSTGGARSWPRTPTPP